MGEPRYLNVWQKVTYPSAILIPFVSGRASCVGVFRFLGFIGKGTKGGAGNVYRIVRNCVMVGKLRSITCGGRRGELFVGVVDIVEELGGGRIYVQFLRDLHYNQCVLLNQIGLDGCGSGKVL